MTHPTLYIPRHHQPKGGKINNDDDEEEERKSYDAAIRLKTRCNYSNTQMSSAASAAAIYYPARNQILGGVYYDIV